MENLRSGVAITHTGNFRSNNEDTVFWGPVAAHEGAGKSLALRDANAIPLLAAVADGVGGCEAGEEASRIAIESIRQRLGSTFRGDRIDTLRAALENAHSAIVQAFQADPSKDGMATTFTGLYFQGPDAYLMHIGDSRCYCYSNEALAQISRDHSPVGTLVADGKLSEAEALNHPFRRYIDRVLGNADKPIDPVVEPVHLQPGDRWMLCSDGLSDSLYREEMESLFQSHKGRPIDTLATALLDRALAKSGRDNISIVIVEIESAKADHGFGHAIAKWVGKFLRTKPTPV